jgi:hypothetical protein
MTAGISLADGFDLAGLDISEIWVRYMSLGGTAAQPRLLAEVAGTVAISDLEHDLIAQALNEVFLDRSVDVFPVSYRRRSEAQWRVATAPVATRPARIPSWVSQSQLVRHRAAEVRAQASATCQRAHQLQRAAQQVIRG